MGDQDQPPHLGFLLHLCSAAGSGRRRRRARAAAPRRWGEEGRRPVLLRARGEAGTEDGSQAPGTAGEHEPRRRAKEERDDENNYIAGTSTTHLRQAGHAYTVAPP
jgi:hypothetical protein